MKNLFACPCCGFHTLDEQPPGTFEICDVCGWEDDDVQASDPDYSGGANVLSLREAQRRWLQSANAQLLSLKKFGKLYKKDLSWKPLQ